jgi:hypothetical protein
MVFVGLRCVLVLFSTVPCLADQQRLELQTKDTTLRACVAVVQDQVTAFQSSFFSFLSLLFAIYSGNTMGFLYNVRHPYVLTVWPALIWLP